MFSSIRKEGNYSVYAVFQQAWPIFVSQLVVAGYSIVDTLIVGHVSTIDLAAVGLGASIFTTVFIFFSGITFALIPLLSEIDSKQQFEKVGEWVRQGIWLSVLLSIPVVLLLTYPEPLLRLGRASVKVSEIVTDYLFYEAISVPALLAFRVFFCLSSAIMGTIILVVFSILGLVMKIPLSYALVYGEYGFSSYGAVGTAMSTCIVSYLEVFGALLLLAVSGKYKKYRVFDRWSWPDMGIQLRFLRLGVPIGFTFFIDFSAITLMGVLVAKLGLSMVGAFRIAATVSYVAYLIPMSIGNAASAIVARNLGEDNLAFAHLAAKSAWHLTAIFGAAVALVMLYYRIPIVAMFTSLPDVRVLASTLLIVVAFFHFSDAFLTVSSGILRGYKKTVFPTIVYGISMWCIGLGGGYYITFVEPVSSISSEQGFFFALGVGAFVGATLLIIYYYKMKDRRSVNPLNRTVQAES